MLEANAVPRGPCAELSGNEIQVAVNGRGAVRLDHRLAGIVEEPTFVVAAIDISAPVVLTRLLADCHEDRVIVQSLARDAAPTFATGQHSS